MVFAHRACLLLALVMAWPVSAAWGQDAEGAGALTAPTPAPPPPVPPPPPADAPPAPAGYPGGEQAYPAWPGEHPAGFPRASAPGPSTEVPVSSRIATRLRVLEADLTMLARRGGSGIVDGVLSILVGGLSITMGALTNDGGVDRRRFAHYLYLWGAGQITRGILSFALPLRADDLAIEYQHMPMRTNDEVRDRLLFGERALERLARRARTARLLDASISTTVGILAIPIYLAPADFEIRSGADYFVIIASGISLITGVVGLILRTEAERRWSAYQKLRERLDAPDDAPLQPPQASRIHLGPGGVGVRF
jgi:hypothetical protein